jgi:hypothetical protein
VCYGLAAAWVVEFKTAVANLKPIFDLTDFQLKSMVIVPGGLFIINGGMFLHTDSL